MSYHDPVVQAECRAMLLNAVHFMWLRPGDGIPKSINLAQGQKGLEREISSENEIGCKISSYQKSISDRVFSLLLLVRAMI